MNARRIANTALALLDCKLIVSWDRTYRRRLLQPRRWLAALRGTTPPPPYAVTWARSWTVNLSVGSGAGSTQRWWNRLSAGPGTASGSWLTNDYGSMRCGHPFPQHCNSAFCGARWCNAHRWPVFGPLFVRGISAHLTWNAKHRDGVKRGLRVRVTNDGNGPYPDGSGCWKSLCLYGRDDRSNPSLVLARASS